MLDLPLQGLKVVVTRPEDQADGFVKALEQAGAVPIRFPVIDIVQVEDTLSLDRALQRISCFDWIVLTSTNGVQAVWERLSELDLIPLPEGLQVAAIGPKTAGALRERSVEPNFVPEEYVAEAITPGLGDLRGRLVLLPRADIARPDLAEAIREKGGFACEVAAYRTVPARVDPQALDMVRSGVDILTFTSSSTVRNFAAVIQNEGFNPLALPGNPLVACIGPITANTAEEVGMRVDVVAESYTTEGLLDALITHLSKQNKIHE